MRNSRLLLAAALSTSLGCAHKMSMPAANTAEADVGVQPKNGTTIVGTFDFDILGDVTGAGCYDPRSRSGYKYATIPGVGADKAAGSTGWVNPIEQAKGAAIYDALTKAPNADTIMVTWTKAEMQADGSACAEVHGKAVHLRKGPTPMQHTPGEGPAMGMMPPPPPPAMPAQPGVPIMPK